MPDCEPEAAVGVEKGVEQLRGDGEGGEDKGELRASAPFTSLFVPCSCVAQRWKSHSVLLGAEKCVCVCVWVQFIRSIKYRN